MFVRVRVCESSEVLCEVEANSEIMAPSHISANLCDLVIFEYSSSFAAVRVCLSLRSSYVSSTRASLSLASFAIVNSKQCHRVVGIFESSKRLALAVCGGAE